MTELVLLTLGPGVLMFLLELLLIRLTRRRFRPLRFLPLFALWIPLLMVFQCWLDGSFLWQLAIVLYLVMAGLMFLGWGLAWIGRPPQSTAPTVPPKGESTGGRENLGL